MVFSTELQRRGDKEDYHIGTAFAQPGLHRTTQHLSRVGRWLLALFEVPKYLTVLLIEHRID